MRTDVIGLLKERKILGLKALTVEHVVLGLLKLRGFQP
jgi:hypothetical protein